MRLAAPLIKDQLGLSSNEVGLILSAFFWSYVPAQLLAGWLAERINAYRTLALGVGFWSIATAASGLASGFVMLMALSVLLGFGESVGGQPHLRRQYGRHHRTPHYRMGGRSDRSIPLGIRDCRRHGGDRNLRVGHRDPQSRAACSGK